ncbi:thioredoxin domain-containing protein [Candidatus Neptunochlamydia vexilliferae]|uniref:Thioredoxin-like fold domain-containing protein n=1 Tax=Candidatus Neptunichlamydia vexilliferae TaxID=1651774 RepID=A0ABS0B132_9BACT|nr:thioredoxin domain-containing protein [Candidatus Neptunochlamydia vexilliferae]MBF5060076.1 hypothetical protein [Candidatus Neptunochlamydia vexilliferae]
MVRQKICKLFFGVVPAFSLLISQKVLHAQEVPFRPSVSFEKLSSIYTISYGDPHAPLHVTEYFSLSCPKCLTFIRRDFPSIQARYIDKGKVYWTFHPDPADLLTLQAMVCFEKLSSQGKQVLIETLAHHPRASFRKGCFKMQEYMDALGKPQPLLHDLSFLEKSQAFQKAFTYLKQPTVPAELPTIEINGKIHQEFPSLQWLDKTFAELLKRGSRHHQTSNSR